MPKLDTLFADLKTVFYKVKDTASVGGGFALAFLDGHSEAGQFRVRWLRRFLVAWWLLTVFWLVFRLFCIDAPAIYTGLFGHTPTSSYGNGDFDVGAFALNYAGSFGCLNLIFDIWVAISLSFMGKIWRQRIQGDKQFTKMFPLVLALCVIFGRFSAFWWSVPISLVPNLWWLIPIKFGALPPILLVISGISSLVALYFSFTFFILTTILFPIKVFQSLFAVSNSMFKANAMKTPFFSTVIKFWYWFTGHELPEAKEVPDDTQGARFAIKDEVEAAQALDGDAFGHVNGVPLHLRNEKHVLIMASTRSGKGTTLIIPHLLRYQGSAFVLDPKGENARATGRRRAKLNKKIFYLDPFGISGKPCARFNPLSRMTLNNMDAESKALAAALVISPEHSDHWTSSAQQLLAGLILYVFASPDIEPEKKDLPNVRRLLLGQVDDTLAAMYKSDVANGILSDLACSFLKTPEKEFGSIVSTAQRQTDILDNPFIAKCLASTGEGEEVDFTDWHTGTMTVYLCLSAPKFPVFNRWLRLVLTAGLDEMTDSLNPPPLPVCFMLDELATLGHLQTVENAVGLAAGYGVQLWTVFQDVAQMKDLYKARWSSFIGNAGVRALFSLDDYDTAHYWSNFIGGHIVQTTGQSKDVWGLTTGQSVSENVRPLLAPEEIMRRYGADKMLVLPQGMPPIEADRVSYWEDQSLDGLWDDPRNPLPNQGKTGNGKKKK